MMMMIMLRVLSLLGPKCRWHRPLSRAGASRAFFTVAGGRRWIRGLLGQNPCAIGTEAVHTGVDSCGLSWTPGKAIRRRATLRQDPRAHRCHGLITGQGRESADTLLVPSPRPEEFNP